MPFNNTKTIKLEEFLLRVQARLQAEGRSKELISFEGFLNGSLAEDLVRARVMSPIVRDGDLIAGDFDAVYPFVANQLWAAAGRNLSEVHPDTYQDAHVVSEAFCAELNEYFECSDEDGTFDLLSIKSPTEMVTAAATAPPAG
jgi:hypothetical protein